MKKCICWVLILLSQTGCGTRKETVLNTSKSLKQLEQQAQGKIIRKEAVREELKHSEIRITLFPPDSTGTQDVESVSYTQIGFIREDSIQTELAKQAFSGLTQQEQQSGQKETGVSANLTGRLFFLFILVSAAVLLYLRKVR